jgi:hypothetical protein
MEMIRQGFGEESISRTWVLEKTKLSKTEKGETGREQSQVHAYNFNLTSRGLITKRSSWQAEQSIPHNIVTFYGNSV